MKAQVDKVQLIEHLQTCVQIEAQKDDPRTAKVLENLIEELKDGQFDYGSATD